MATQVVQASNPLTLKIAVDAVIAAGGTIQNICAMRSPRTLYLIEYIAEDIIGTEDGDELSTEDGEIIVTEG